MIMNYLVMNILSLVKFGLLIQFTHLKPSSYKDGKKARIYIVLMLSKSKHLAVKTSLDFDKILDLRFIQEKPLTPGV